MIKLERFEVMNIESAIRGARNPMNSWKKSDSFWVRDTNMCKGCSEVSCNNCPAFTYVLGNNDLDLAKRLCNAGSDHRKFLRQIFVSVDITAPLYWWKEFDTYKVGTVANSTSTMHKLATTPITMNCFEIDDYISCLQTNVDTLGFGHSENHNLNNDVSVFIECLEDLRLKYLETNDKRYWKELIRWLPESWLQTRTITMSYQNLRQMYFARRNHKLTEWSINFINWIEELPYAKELIMFE